MDLILFTNSFAPQECPTAEALGGLSRALRERGHRVLVVAPALRDRYHRDPWVLRFPLDRVVRGLTPLPDAELPAGFSPDVVHSFDPFMAGELALRCARRRDLPLVFTPSLLYPGLLDTLTTMSSNYETLVDAMTTRYAASADLVVATDPMIHRGLVRRRVRPHRQVLPMGVDPFWYEPPRRSLRSRAAMETGLRLGVVGRLAPESGAPGLLETVRRFLEESENATAVVAGQGPSLDLAQELVGEAGMPGRLQLIEPRTRPALKAVFRRIDVLLTTTRCRRSFGWEGPAQASGVEVVRGDDATAALERLRRLDERGPGARVAQRRVNTATATPIDQSAEAMEARYRDAVRFRATEEPTPLRDLPRQLASLTPALAGAWEELDLKSLDLLERPAA